LTKTTTNLKLLWRIIRRLGGVIAGVLAVSFLSGCLLTMPKPLLSARHVPDPPNLVGRYLDEKGQEVRVLGRDNTSNNTFVAYPPSKKNPITMTVQHLDGLRYLIQAQPEGSVGVFLTVGEINLPKVTIYCYPVAVTEIVALAKKREVTVNKEGLITEYKSASGIINLFMDLFNVKDKESLVFIKQAK
jgi:hypothetical protein